MPSAYLQRLAELTLLGVYSVPSAEVFLSCGTHSGSQASQICLWLGGSAVTALSARQQPASLPCLPSLRQELGAICTCLDPRRAFPGKPRNEPSALAVPHQREEGDLSTSVE